MAGKVASLSGRARPGCLYLQPIEALKSGSDTRGRHGAGITHSFTVDGIDPKEVESKLDKDGVIVRGGDLNTKLLMHTLGLPSAVRASFMFYNTKQDADALVRSLQHVVKA